MHLFFPPNFENSKKSSKRFPGNLPGIHFLENETQKWILRIKLDLNANFHENLSTLIFQKKNPSVTNLATCQLPVLCEVPKPTYNMRDIF